MRNLALVCGGLAVVGSIVSVNLWRELRAERQVTNELRVQLSNQAPSLPGAIGATQPAAPMPSEPAAESAVTATSPAPATVPQAAPARAPVTNVALQARDLLQDPEYRRAALAQARLTLPQNYPGLVEELNLTQEQADKLFDMLAELQLEQTSVSLSFGSDGQPDPAAVEEMSRRAREIQQRRDERITALLGSSGQQQFNAYEQTRGARMQALNIQRMMESSGMPLTAAQMKPITEAYIADQRRQRDVMQSLVTQAAALGPEAASARMQELQAQQQVERNRGLIEAARPHLTAQQLERLQATLEQQLAMSRASLRLVRERAEAQARAGGTVQNPSGP